MPRISELYAFIGEDNGPENEGICGCPINGMLTPLIAADAQRVVSLVPYADNIRATLGRRYRICRFPRREDVTKAMLRKPPPKGPSSGGKVNEIFAFITLDKGRPDDEGILVSRGPMPMPLALVRRGMLRTAIEDAKTSGREFRIYRYFGREDVTERFIHLPMGERNA